MPQRWLSILIVIFWLTTSALFFRHEWWPYLEPGAPPPFAIELVDEARNPVPATWKVSLNGELVLIAKTNVEHSPTDNTFTLLADFQPALPKKTKPSNTGLTIQRMTSRYRVTPEGQLLHLDASVAASYMPAFAVGATRTPVAGKAEVSGDVANG